MLLQYRAHIPSTTIFFSTDTPPTDIYTLSLHDALPIWPTNWASTTGRGARACACCCGISSRPEPSSRGTACVGAHGRSEEHTSELQSHVNLVCRLLLEKKKKNRLIQYVRQSIHNVTLIP